MDVRPESTGCADDQRLERDSLGEIAVPAQALYGARTARAIANLSFSGRVLGNCKPYVRALAAVKIAAARANREAGVLPAQVAESIELAARRMSAGELDEHLAVDLFGGGGSIGIHVNVNEVLANVANEACGGRRGQYEPVRPGQVGASQSTADVCHTALRLAVLSSWPALETSLIAMRDAVTRQASELRPVETMSRTCLRDAMPVSLAVLFAGYGALWTRRISELRHSIEALRIVSLGGTVIGTGDGAPALYRERVVPILAAVTDLPLACRAVLPDALQNSDDMASVSTQLRLIAEALLKIGADLRLLSSGPHGGFGEIELPAVQEGSTFFAGKSNPVIPETAMQCAFQVLGCDSAVQAANQHAELYLNVFDGLAAVNVLDAMAMLTRAVTLLASRCIAGLTANNERCAELAAAARR